jgi:hypothetical protein
VQASFVSRFIALSQGHVELLALYIVVFAMILFTGPGFLSIDAFLEERRSLRSE